MLQFESDLVCIPAGEPQVLEVHRSTEPVCLDVDAAAEHPLEAFVCLCKKESERQVYVAFYLKKLKRSLIYSLVGGGSGEGDDLLERALGAVEALGFVPQGLNLNFGQAMREVILRQIPVLCPSEIAGQLKRQRDAELVELRRRAAGDGDEPEPAGSVSGGREEQTARREAQEAARRLALEQRHAAQMEAVRGAIDGCLLALHAPAAIAAAEEERRRLLADNRSLEARCLELEAAAARQESAAEKAGTRLADLEAALHEGQEQLEAVQQRASTIEREANARIADLERELLEAREAAAEARAGNDDRKEKLTVADERQAELEEALAAASAECESTRIEAQRHAEARACAERRAAELEVALRQAVGEEEEARKKGEESARRAAELEEDLRRLAAEAAEERSALTGRLVELEETVSRRRDELEAERFEREILVREKRLAEQRLTEVADTERPEADRGRLIGPSAGMEAEQRIGSLTEALGMAEERVAFLRDELERMAAHRGTGEIPDAETAARAASKPRLAPIRLAPDSASAAEGEAEGEAEVPPPHVVRRPPRRGAFFHVDWDRSRIDYQDPGEVLEVYQSAGMVQLSLEGYPNQFCSSCIVTLQQGRRRQVHLAFMLTESRRTLIYSPAKPLRNQADYDRAIKEAFKYLEVVGCCPEKVPLGDGATQRGKDLSRIAVLCGPVDRAQGF